jgi:hypothetical protein
VPNIGLNHEHVLRIGSDHVGANKEVLVQEAKIFGITGSHAPHGASKGNTVH